ncbi:MAG: internal scaffolding protein [Microviridae sp.]|nr:MAG: internal scaffolding protein [Microviridae sp.]
MSSNKRTTQTQTLPFRDAYSTPLRVQVQFTQPSRTKQSFKDECDINRIVARFNATGQLPNINEIPPQYLDVSEMDFQAHQNFIAEAQTMFNELPSALRARFENQPGKFLEFCSQEKNRPEMAEMGLLRPVKEPVVPLVSTDPPAPPGGAKPTQAPGA